MSNKKQSSIDWLFEQVWINPVSKLPEILEQAKAMHKEEIRVAYMDGAFEKIRHLDGKEFMMPTDYYNETFGGQDNE
jgi:hypothetical protein